MTDDERAIRDLVATWMPASQAGDVSTVLGLMADDVVFMVPGREPFGRLHPHPFRQGCIGDDASVPDNTLNNYLHGKALLILSPLYLLASCWSALPERVSAGAAHS